MRVAMIGTGYVGLVSGACFADFGHHVICVDKDAEQDRGAQARRDADLRAGARRIWSPANVRAGRLSFTTDLKEPVADARGGVHRGRHAVAPRRRPRRPDLRLRRGARDRGGARRLSPWWSPSRPCRSAPATRSSASSARRGRMRSSRWCPIRNSCARAPRSATSSMPDRIVVGTEDERAKQVMAELYRPLYLNRSPILITDRRTAELIKYAANAFLATKITFINEIADLCEKVGADVQEVARGIGLDNRIGRKFLHAGAGLRRLVLSQGHAGADQDRAGPRRAAAHRRDGRGGQRRAQARDGAQGHGGARRHRCAARPSPCSASPSSRTPTTCATRRRSR